MNISTASKMPCCNAHEQYHTYYAKYAPVLVPMGDRGQLDGGENVLVRIPELGTKTISSDPMSSEFQVRQIKPAGDGRNLKAGATQRPAVSTWLPASRATSLLQPVFPSLPTPPNRER